MALQRLMDGGDYSGLGGRIRYVRSTEENEASASALRPAGQMWEEALWISRISTPVR